MVYSFKNEMISLYKSCRFNIIITMFTIIVIFSYCESRLTRQS
jgi:hypothetical protein